MKNIYSISMKELDYIITNSLDDLRQFSNAHIFMTGCTGFLGKWLVESLLYASETLGLQLRLSVLTRSKERVYADMPLWKEHKNLHLVDEDICTYSPARTEGITHIIHGANYPNSGQEHWALEHMTIAHDGTRNILRLAQDQGVSAMVLMSSGAVYGLRQGGTEPPYKEQESATEDYVREANVYALCKHFTETYTAAYGQKHGIRIPIARLFTFYGEHMPMHSRQALNSFMMDAEAGRDIVIQGDGTSIRSYMHASDMAICMFALLARGEHGKPYNIGSNKAISIKELAEKVVRDSGKDLKVIVLGKAALGNAPNIYVPDVGEMLRMLYYIR